MKPRVKVLVGKDKGKYGRIIQIRGKTNKKAPDEVFDITKTWLKENEKHLIA